jgi:recombination protein RecT
MDRDQILAIRDRSSSKTKEGKIVGPWATDQDEMWRKTVVRRASKYMPLSTEAQRAVMADNQAEGIQVFD